MWLYCLDEYTALFIIFFGKGKGFTVLAMKALEEWWYIFSLGTR